jgi:hypothetical protein
MTLRDFLDACTGDEEVRWNETAAMLLGEGRADVKDNFEKDHWLEAVVWQAVFLGLPQVSLVAFVGVASAVFQGHTLRGAPIAGTPQPKGRALEAGRFLQLAQAASLVATRAQAEQLLNDVRARINPPIPYDRLLADCELGRYFMWSTFNAPGGGDPFFSCPDAATTRNHYGLTEPNNPADRELVLCLYTLPAGMPVRYPTIADAYAGSNGNDWNPLFRSSNPGAPWGRTSGGRPEVVHELITGRYLTEHTAATPPLRSVT